MLAARPHELRSSENAGLKPGRYKRLSPRPTFKKAKVKIRTLENEGCGTQKGKSRSLVIVDARKLGVDAVKMPAGSRRYENSRFLGE